MQVSDLDFKLDALGNFSTSIHQDDIVIAITMAHENWFDVNITQDNVHRFMAIGMNRHGLEELLARELLNDL